MYDHHMTLSQELPAIHYAGLGLLVAVTGIIGDLCVVIGISCCFTSDGSYIRTRCESIVKRAGGVKDRSVERLPGKSEYVSVGCALFTWRAVLMLLGA